MSIFYANKIVYITAIKESLLIKKIVKSAVIVTILSIITRIISFIFKVYLSRELGAEKLGLLQISLTFLMTLSCLTIAGLPTTISRKTAAFKNDNNRILAMTSAGLVISTTISIFIVLLLYLLKDYLYLFFNDINCIPVFVIMLPTLISSSIYYIIRGYFWGKKEFTIFSATELIEEVLRIAFTIGILSFGVSTISKEIGLAIAFTIADYICGVILISFFFIKGGRLIKPKGGRNLIKSSAPITIVRLISSLMATIVAAVLPLMLTRIGLTTSEATATFGRIMGMATPMLTAPLTLTSSIAIVLVPELATFYNKNRSIVRKKVDSAFTISIVISCLFLIAFLSLGRDLCELLYKDREAGIYLERVAIIIIPMNLFSISITMLNSIGEEKKSMINYVAGTVLLLLAIFILPPFIGEYSYPVGQFLSYMVTLLLNIHSLKKLNATDSGYYKSLVLSIGCAVLCITFSYMLKSILSNFMSQLAYTLICGALSCGSYVLLLFALRVIDIDLIKLTSRKKSINNS